MQRAQIAPWADQPVRLWNMFPRSCRQVLLTAEHLWQIAGRHTVQIVMHVCVQVLAQLRSKVDVTRRLLPVLQALINPALRKHHWALLVGIVGSQDIVDDATTAQQLLDLQVCPDILMSDTTIAGSITVILELQSCQGKELMRVRSDVMSRCNPLYSLEIRAC